MEKRAVSDVMFQFYYLIFYCGFDGVYFLQHAVLFVLDFDLELSRGLILLVFYWREEL